MFDLAGIFFAFYKKMHLWLEKERFRELGSKMLPSKNILWTTPTPATTINAVVIGAGTFCGFASYKNLTL